MTLMTGMTPKDSKGGMAMPGCHLMDMGVARLSYDWQGGASGKKVVECHRTTASIQYGAEGIRPLENIPTL
ncbi:MAG: hypothetical protein ABI682_06280 [Acidobacteriota bacterium]